jgi:D-3-phosphoglycerate dehydrogenase
MYKILIADDRHEGYEQEYEIFKSVDAEVVVEKSQDENVLAEAVKGVDGLLVNLSPITAKVIQAMDKCKCVCRYGVGYDNVDADALKEKGIFLANVPDYCQEDVSDHALALIMDCVRKISRKDRAVRKGQWNLTGVQAVYRMTGKVFGFLGYGGIARCLHRKIDGFNFEKVLIYDPFIKKDSVEYKNTQLVSLEQLCKEADCISVHAPLNKQTSGILGENEFKLMKSSAMVVNTSRGGLIDTNALISALKTGEIACAGLDVFESEPLEADSQLRMLENVTLTDHTGWYSHEAIIELKTKAAQNILSAIQGEKPKYVVKI